MDRNIPAHLLLARHIQNVSDGPIQLFSWHIAQAVCQPEKIHIMGYVFSQSDNGSEKCVPIWDTFSFVRLVLYNFSFRKIIGVKLKYKLNH